MWSIPRNLLCTIAGRWYFVHGGAGSVMSSGAMDKASFQAVSDFLLKIETVSGGQHSNAACSDLIQSMAHLDLVCGGTRLCASVVYQRLCPLLYSWLITLLPLIVC